MSGISNLTSSNPFSIESQIMKKKYRVERLWGVWSSSPDCGSHIWTGDANHPLEAQRLANDDMIQTYLTSHLQSHEDPKRVLEQYQNGEPFFGTLVQCQELSYYSLIINWNDENSEEGTFSWSGYATDLNEAETLAYDEMRTTDMENTLTIGQQEEAKNAIYGSVSESFEGANIWRAAEAHDILQTCLEAWELASKPETPEFIITALTNAKNALRS